MPKAHVNGINVYYEEHGEGFPLVLLHPWPTDHAMWMFQVPVFSEKYHVITPDSRGLGRSDKPGEGYDLKTLAKDVCLLLDKLGVRKAFVIGNSLGASVCQRFTIDYPEMVQAAAFIGAPTYPIDELPFVEEVQGKQKPFSEVYLDALRSKGYLYFWETVWKPTMPFQLSLDFVKSRIGSYVVKYLFEQRYARLNDDPNGVIDIMEALRREDSMMEELRRLRVPSALICGDHDDSFPMMEAQHKACPQFQYLVIKNSGHFCFLDNSEQFNEFLYEFFRKHSTNHN